MSGELRWHINTCNLDKCTNNNLNKLRNIIKKYTSYIFTELREDDLCVREKRESFVCELIYK